MTTEVADNTILSRVLANGDTSAFVPSTDALQLVRDEIVVIDGNVDSILVDTGTTLDGKINTIDTNVDAVLVDTGTTLQAELDAIQAATITNAAGADIAADIIAVKAETAAILTDTGTTLDGKINTIDTNVDAILVDTGTTLQGELDAIQAATITNAAGVDIAADIIAVKAETAAILTDTGTTLDGKINTIDTNVDAILVDTGTTLQGEVDAIQAAVITNAAGVDIAADIIAIKAETALIVADTNELQTDDYPTSIAALQTDLDTLTDARGEPAQGAPPLSATTNLKIDHIYKQVRNKQDSDGSTEQYYNDDAVTVDSKRTVSAAAGTVTKAEIVSGP
jgi:ElaB/YqjD/DUF883 family membrane-anchored ribosome-binding protein